MIALDIGSMIGSGIEVMFYILALGILFIAGCGVWEMAKWTKHKLQKDKAT